MSITAPAVTATRRVTRAEYRTLPEGPPYYELINGELVEMVRARRPHDRIAGRLFRIWDLAIESRFGGELALEPNLYLPGIEDVYHPDLAYVAPARLAICEDHGIEGTPDVICEILSPSTEKTDRQIKMNQFRQAGVPHVWLIDPKRPVTVEEYVLEADGQYRLNATVTAPTEFSPASFPGWTIPMEELDAVVAPAIPSDAAPGPTGSEPA